MTPAVRSTTVDGRARALERQRARRAGGQQISQVSRQRLLAAMAAVVAKHGVAGVTVGRLVESAGVSRATFYKIFDDTDDCLLATIDQAVELARARAQGPWESHEDWLAGVRAALRALLEFFEEEPGLAQLCVIHSTVPKPAIIARRTQVLAELASIIDRARNGSRDAPAPLTAEAVVGGAIGVVHGRLTQKPSGLLEVANPLMAFIARPYRGAGVARRELERPLPPSRTTRPRKQPYGRRARAARPLSHPDTRITYRTARVLSAIAATPGISNADAAKRAGISDQGQISKLLNRLARAGLAKNTGAGQAQGSSNAWHLTADGERLAWSFDHELSAWA